MLITNATLATMATSLSDEPYGLIESGAVAFSEDKIVWAGAMADIPENLKSEEAIDAGGRLITPAFIDCHTHIVHGGNRAKEFEMRLEGASYEEVARAGGGIVSTVSHTRAASEEELVQSALPRLDALLAEGVSCVEVNCGCCELHARLSNIGRCVLKPHFWVLMQFPVNLRTDLTPTLMKSVSRLYTRHTKKIW